MGVMSASSGFTRYRIIEDIPDELWSAIPDKLYARAFQEIEDTSDERSIGWVAIENFLDNAWRENSPLKADYLAFTFRMDTRRISPAVYKKHLQLAMEQAQRALPEHKKYLSKDRKKELKENVKARLMQRSFPIPAVTDAVWDRSRNLVWLTSTNSKTRAAFEDLFAQTFDLHLEPLTPYYLAASILSRKLGEDAAWKLLGDVESSAFA